MKRAKAKFVKKNSQDLPSFYLSFTEEQINEMRTIVSTDLIRIEADYKEQISRLDAFIKKEIGAIPRSQEFADWFFKKKKIHEWGSKLPMITDEQIIGYAKEYVASLKAINTLPKQPNLEDVESFKFLKDATLIKVLRDKLAPTYISPDTTVDTFKEIFTGKPLKAIKTKVDWLLEGKNGDVNKRGIYDLIVCLEQFGFIEPVTDKKSLLLKRMSGTFTYNNKRLPFTNSNLKASEHYKSIEKIVKSIR